MESGRVVTRAWKIEICNVNGSVNVGLKVLLYHLV
jgi:hypothetical protein